MTKIFGIGLPRCGGQTLQMALGTVTGKRIWHSVGKHYNQIQPDHGGAVECFAPVSWLDDNYPDCKFVWNLRDVDSWLASCERVYHKSAGWNHPLWLYPLSQFRDYYEEYCDNLRRWCKSVYLEDRILQWNIMENPSWQPLCDFLGVPVPNERFPNVDRVGR